MTRIKDEDLMTEGSASSTTSSDIEFDDDAEKRQNAFVAEARRTS